MAVAEALVCDSTVSRVSTDVASISRLFNTVARAGPNGPSCTSRVLFLVLLWRELRVQFSRELSDHSKATASLCYNPFEELGILYGRSERRFVCG